MASLTAVAAVGLVVVFVIVATALGCALAGSFYRTLYDLNWAPLPSTGEKEANKSPAGPKDGLVDKAGPSFVDKAHASLAATNPNSAPSSDATLGKGLLTILELPKCEKALLLRQYPNESFNTALVVWDSGDALARWLCEHGLPGNAGPVADLSSAIELGTGTGIVSLALARRGVRRVVATDGDAQALAVAKANAQRNKLSDAVTTLPLIWGSVSGGESVA